MFALCYRFSFFSYKWPRPRASHDTAYNSVLPPTTSPLSHSNRLLDSSVYIDPRKGAPSPLFSFIGQPPRRRGDDSFRVCPRRINIRHRLLTSSPFFLVFVFSYRVQNVSLWTPSGRADRMWGTGPRTKKGRGIPSRLPPPYSPVQVMDQYGNVSHRVGFKIGGGIDQDPTQSPFNYPDTVS